MLLSARQETEHVSRRIQQKPYRRCGRTDLLPVGVYQSTLAGPVMACVSWPISLAKPLGDQFMRWVELKPGRASARVGIRQHPLPGDHLLKKFPRGAEPVGVFFNRDRLYQTVRCLTSVLTSPGILNRTELKPKDRKSEFGLQSVFAPSGELISTWMLRRRIRKQNYITPFWPKQPFLGSHECEGGRRPTP